MSSDNQATVSAVQSPAAVEQSTERSENPASQSQKVEKQQIKALLSEARNTRQMLTEFKAAIHNAGSFPGHAMLPVAKGLAFLDAILEQNRTHVKNLEERLEA